MKKKKKKRRREEKRLYQYCFGQLTHYDTACLRHYYTIMFEKGKTVFVSDIIKIESKSYFCNPRS